MVLELKQEELNRLDDLLSNEWRGKKPYLARPDKVKITAKQVKRVKSLLKAGVPMVTIQNIKNYQSIMFVVCAEVGMTSSWIRTTHHTESHHGDNMHPGWLDYLLTIFFNIGHCSRRLNIMLEKHLMSGKTWGFVRKARRLE